MQNLNENQLEQEIKITPLTINNNTKNVYINKTKINLSKLEFEILIYLAKNKNRVISRNEIRENVREFFGYNRTNSNVVDVYITLLRKKIGKDIIETKRGYGYLIVDKI